MSRRPPVTRRASSLTHHPLLIVALAAAIPFALYVRHRFESPEPPVPPLIARVRAQLGLEPIVAAEQYLDQHLGEAEARRRLATVCEQADDPVGAGLALHEAVGADTIDRYVAACVRIGWLEEASAALQRSSAPSASSRLALAAAWVTRGERARSMAALAALEREASRGLGRDDWLNGAMTWYQCRRPERASEWARRGLAEETTSVPARLVLARCLLAEGRADEALATLPTDGGADPSVTYWRARAGLRAGDPARRRAAVAHLAQLGAGDPPDPVAAFEAGRAYLQAGNASAAVPLLAQAARQSYQEVLAHELLDRALHSLGQKARAAWARGRAERLRGRLEASRISLGRSTTLDPTPLGPYLELSSTLSLEGNPRGALATLERARERHPKDLDLTLAIADTLNQLDRFTDQARELETAASRHPDRAFEPLGRLGRMYYETRRFDQVILVLERATRLRDDAEAHRYLGLSLALRPDPRSTEQALVHLLRAAALDPADGTQWTTAGALLQRQGRLAEAAVCYRQAIRWDPSAPGAYVALAQALQRRNRSPEAAILLRLYRRNRDLAARRRQLENRVEVNRADAEAHLELGDLLFRYESYRNAYPYLLIAASLRPDWTRAQERLADVCALLDYTDMWQYAGHATSGERRRTP